ncbi:MAG: N-acetylneuraminate synthase [Oscillospiraceae bacterium]
MDVCIIAEAGVNHNGSLQMAKEMALAAKNAGADYVKYQTAVPELVISRYAPKAGYQKVSTGEAESQLEMVKKLHFGFEEHCQLKQYCDSIGIGYLSSAFDLPSVDFLASLHMDLFKIPSGEITNLPYLEKIAALQCPVVLSTGMSEMEEIGQAVEILQKGGAKSLVLLHCNTEYPTPYKDANLKAMTALQQAFNLPVGLSDHTPGWECDVAAVALGAVVIEKHFTLDKALPGPDQQASLDVAELTAMVSAVRNTQLALGSGVKQVSNSERRNRGIARKSIVAARAIAKGEAFTADNLAVKRPAGGISPMDWYKVLGQTAQQDFAVDEPIQANI